MQITHNKPSTSQQKNFTFGVKNESILQRNLKQLKQQIYAIESNIRKPSTAIEERTDFSTPAASTSPSREQDLSTCLYNCTDESYGRTFKTQEQDSTMLNRDPLITRILTQNSFQVREKEEEIVKIKTHTEKIIRSIESLQRAEERELESRLRAIDAQYQQKQAKARDEYAKKLSELKQEYDLQCKKERERSERNVWAKAEQLRGESNKENVANKENISSKNRQNFYYSCQQSHKGTQRKASSISQSSVKKNGTTAISQNQSRKNSFQIGRVNLSSSSSSSSSSCSQTSQNQFALAAPSSRRSIDSGRRSFSQFTVADKIRKDNFIGKIPRDDKNTRLNTSYTNHRRQNTAINYSTKKNFHCYDKKRESVYDCL